MFTIPSLTKILVVAGALLAIWYGFKLIGRLDRERKRAVRTGHSGKPAARPAGARKADAVKDLTECARCHAFVPPAATCSQCGAALPG